MRTVALIMVVPLLAALVGCTQTQSTLAGAGAGAATGAIIGHQSGKTAQGALIGGAIGALGGYLYGQRYKKTASDGSVQNMVKCPNAQCGSELQLPANVAAGTKLKCSSCGTEFVLQ